MKKYLPFLLILLSVQSGLFSQTIAAVRLMPIGSTVTVRGIVINGNELGTIRYVQDATGGIALYGSNLASVNRGDSIVATGTMTDYNSLLEVTPVTSFTIYTPVGPVPVTQLITPAQAGEPLESELVTINQVTFTNGGSPIAGNTSYTFTAAAQSGVIYVRNGSPLVGQILPLWPITLTGVMSQFYTTYQMLPRDSFDIVNNSSIVVTTPVTQSNITANGFNLNWTTNISGTTFIRYGFTPALELGMISGAPGINHTVPVSGASPSDIFYAQVFSVAGPDTATSTIRAYATVSASAGWIKVYFNKSVDTTLSTGTDAELLFYAMDDTLIAYIDRAQHSIDFTIYHFDNQNISNISTALNNAYTRGVRVRVIVDGSYTHPAVSQLDPGIEVLYSPVGGIYGIMHNKFVVIDALSTNPNEAIVWTGGTNFSDGQINTDPNDVIIFQDQSMAKGYTIEFEEMWGDTGLIPDSLNAKFGPDKTNNTPHEYVVGGVRVEQYFSPSDGTNAKIDETIGSADVDLYVATMLITRSDLAAEIVTQSASGVDAYVLVDDATSTTTWSTLQAGLPVTNLIDYSLSGIMHHKYMIVDPSAPASDPIVLTGCHNWSTSADTKNDENTVIVHDATIANIYYQEFVPRFNQSGGTIGVQENTTEYTTLSAFPNPANDQVNVNYTTAEATTTTCALTDVTGRVISTTTQSSVAGANLITMDVSGLAPGVYFIQISNELTSGTVSIAVE